MPTVVPAAALVVAAGAEPPVLEAPPEVAVAPEPEPETKNRSQLIVVSWRVECNIRELHSVC